MTQPPIYHPINNPGIAEILLDATTLGSRRRPPTIHHVSYVPVQVTP